MKRDFQDLPTKYGSGGESDVDLVGFSFDDDVEPVSLRSISRYEIIDKIGHGGGGIVYRAIDLDLHREVAIKILLKSFCSREDIIQRFVNESKIVCQLQHPGVAPVFDCGVCENGRPFYTMKLVGGFDLRQFLKQPRDGDKLSIALEAFTDVCQTVAYAHSMNIVHLDIKPANIMIGSFGEVHLMDWGSARHLDSDGKYEALGMIQKTGSEPKDLTRMVGGTLEYLAPEQAKGGRLDKRTDVFALGATLCHIITQSPPYSEKDRFRAYQKAADGDLLPAYMDLVQSHADPMLVQLAISCLQVDPLNRPRDAYEVANSMAAFRESSLVQFQSDMSRFFELSPDLFCIASLDGYFRRINSNFSTVLGHSNSDLIAKPFLEFVHPDDHQETLNAMQCLNEGKPVIRFGNRYRTASGSYVRLEWTAKSIPEEGIVFAVARFLGDA